MRRAVLSLLLLACGPYETGGFTGATPFTVLAEDAEAAEFATILDVRPADDWAQGHLPGIRSVVLVDVFPYNEDDDPETEAAVLAERFAALDVREPVLVVGEPGEWGEDGWGWWLLRYAGFEDARVLVGGYSAYVLAGGEVDLGAADEPTGGLPPASRPDRAASVADVEAHIAAGHVLLDTRTRGEWDEGHIPGATFWEHGSAFTPSGELLAEESLREQLARLGVTDLDQPLIVYCQGGFRSGHNVWVLELLGFRSVLNFRGSISTWTAMGKPVE